MGSNGTGKEKKQPSESDIEKYAQDNLNRHKKGIFRKKFTIQDMLSWSKVTNFNSMMEIGYLLLQFIN